MRFKQEWCAVCRGLWIGLLIIMFAIPAWSESLKELQEKAIANRKLVEKYKAEVRKSELDVSIGKSAFLPSADVSYTANRLDEGGMSESKENSSISGVISYNIFSGFRHKYNLQSAEHIQKSKEYQLQTTIQDLKFQVAGKYIDMYGKKRSLKVSEDEFALLSKRYEDALSRFNVGLIRKNDLLKIKVELDNTDQGMKKAQTEYNKSIHTMAYQIGADIDASGLTFNEFDEIPAIQDFAAYQARMFENRNELKALEMALQARKSSVMTAKAALYPSVDIAGSLRKYGNNYYLGEGDNTESEARIQLNVRMNLFDGFQKYDSIKKAELEVKTVEYDIEELKNSLSLDLKNILLDYDVSFQNLKVAESSISQAEENLRITDLSYKEGVGTAADVLDAVYYLSRAKFNYINARNEVFLNYYKLLRMTDDL